MAGLECITAVLEAKLRVAETTARNYRLRCYDNAGIERPRPVPIVNMQSADPAFLINTEEQRALSEYIRSAGLSFEGAVRFWRGDQLRAGIPNPALHAEHLDWLLDGYHHRGRVVNIAQHGVRHKFTQSIGEREGFHKNHKSAVLYCNALRRSIREGQENGRYMVVDRSILDDWGSVAMSPFGCVPKGDNDPNEVARVIHDLSYPKDHSVNSASDQEQLPSLHFTPVTTLAARIEALHRKSPSTPIRIEKGDVSGAFRHVASHPSVCCRFGGVVDESTSVVDLSLPFGWTGSPAHYQLFGSAISFLVSRESPRSLRPSSQDSDPFFSFEWVDDYVLIEHDIGDRLELADLALRMAMVAVLGPRAVNAEKFTTWSGHVKALGLEWDTEARTVSIPKDKIAKALARVVNMLACGRASKHSLAQVLGSLRHVCTCVRSAKPLLQRLVDLWRRAPDHATVELSIGATLDLEWFAFVLSDARLRGIPTRFFGSLPEPEVHFYMDASNTGLCVLNPALQQFIRFQFDEEERRLLQEDPVRFTINVREEFGAVLGLLVWLPQIHPPTQSEVLHVRCWIDNASAVSWCNSLYSPNVFAQELNRIIGAAEARWNVYVSAGHLAGSTNRWADLGSRAWAGPQLQTWTNISCEWQECQVPSEFRKAYLGNSSPFNKHPSQNPLNDSMPRRGGSGAASVPNMVTRNGSLVTTSDGNHFSWLSSLYRVGRNQQVAAPMRLAPSNPSYAMSVGIIEPTADLFPPLNPTTNLSSAACVAPAGLHSSATPSRSTSSVNSVMPLTCPTPNTAFFLGLRCWASSFSSEVQNILNETENGRPTHSKLAISAYSTNTESPRATIMQPKSGSPSVQARLIKQAKVSLDG